MVSPCNQTNRWRIAAGLWIALIFLSCTSGAGQWSEHTYDVLGSIFARYLRADVASSTLVHFLAEKGVHVFLFVVLAILLWNAIQGAHYKFTSILLVGTVVGSCSELLQRLFPERDPSLRDVGINVAATALGALISSFLFKWKRRETGGV
jgi:VanZ family protein